ncbi:hypothetical protein IMCC21224_12387 [Puniceibacterium sp. IMCC21224]|nr:hypothetical protein IMCC21224_12387 [Puniceibacterium sp. IMCC21224]
MSRGSLDGGSSVIAVAQLSMRVIMRVAVPMVIGLRVVHPQQFHAVVIAARRAHDGVDVKPFGRRVGQNHAVLVVEWTCHAKVPVSQLMLGSPSLESQGTFPAKG